MARLMPSTQRPNRRVPRALAQPEVEARGSEKDGWPEVHGSFNEQEAEETCRDGIQPPPTAVPDASLPS